MRFNRLGALVAWLAMASIAVAGFAAYSAPSPADSAPALADSGDSTPETSGASAVGNAAGRVAAMSLASDPLAATSDVSGSLLIQKDALSGAVAAAAPTTTQATTTEAAQVTEAPPATEPPAATTSPTTEAPPVTEPPVETPYIPPGTESWVGLVEANFAPADVEQALMIISCESNGNSSATNSSSGAAGLFQHLPKYWEERSAAAGWAGADIYDPAANIAVAAWLVYSGGGWSHWAPSAGCWS